MLYHNGYKEQLCDESVASYVVLHLLAIVVFLIKIGVS